MTDELRHLLRTEASGLDVPRPPTDALVAGGRRIRHRRQAGLAAAVAACVIGAVVGGFGIARLGDDPDGSPGPSQILPTPTPTPTPTEGATPSRIDADGTGIASQTFGTPQAQALAALTERLGEPDLVVGPKNFIRIPGEDGYFESADNIEPSWKYPVFSATCWSTLCLLYGGPDADGLTLRGWEVGDYRRWADDDKPPADPRPDVRLTGTDVGLGATWPELEAAFPGISLTMGEGGSLVIAEPPWRGIFDGVGEWRLSGYAESPEPPYRAQPDSVVTRLSGGEGPQPGCC